MRMSEIPNNNVETQSIEQKIVELRLLYTAYIKTSAEAAALQIREKMAKMCLDIYSGYSDAFSAAQAFEGIVNEISEISINDGEKIISRFAEKYPDPLETMLATSRNLLIAKDFSNTLVSSADTVVLSGANAWGSFFAVTDKVFESHRKNKASDIDLFGIFPNNESIFEAGKNIARAYPTPGLLERAAHAHALFAEKSIDVFSTRILHRDVELSFHAYTRSTCKMIAYGNEPRNDRGIGFLRDFRETFPNNVREFGGYPTMDILSGQSEIFTPNIKRLPDNLGYICDAPTGKIEPNDVRIGLTLFFFLIAPAPLQRSAFFEETRQQLLGRVRTAVSGREISRIFRDERMTNRMLEEIKRSLSTYG